MKLCYQCLLARGLRVQQPQILKLYKGCDGCERKFTTTWLEADVIEQKRILEK